MSTDDELFSNFLAEDAKQNQTKNCCQALKGFCHSKCAQKLTNFLPHFIYYRTTKLKHPVKTGWQSFCQFLTGFSHGAMNKWMKPTTEPFANEE